MGPFVCQSRLARFGQGLICLLLVHAALAQDRSSTTAGPASTRTQPAGAVAESDLAVRGVVIPTGFQGGRYSAMIQIAVHGSPLPDAAWDLEGSFVS